MRMEDICTVLFPTVRSMAYVQAMAKVDIFPSQVYVVKGDPGIPEKVMESSAEFAKDFFDLGETVTETLGRCGIDYVELDAKNINDEVVYDTLARVEAATCIYSGGGRVGKDLLALKRFIHVHPGKLPQYRGSTCFYYSYIQDGVCSATAIFLTPELDKGPVIYSKDFGAPMIGELDWVYDPYIRSEVLRETLSIYAETGSFPESYQDRSESRDYYIIHPVLRHLARLRIEGQAIL